MHVFSLVVVVLVCVEQAISQCEWLVYDWHTHTNTTHKKNTHMQVDVDADGWNIQMFCAPTRKEAHRKTSAGKKLLNKKMICKHAQMHSHTQSLIPSSHLYACATRMKITHAPSYSRVLHCSTFPLLEPVHRAYSLTRSRAHTKTIEVCTQNAEIHIKTCMHSNKHMPT